MLSFQSCVRLCGRLVVAAAIGLLSPAYLHALDDLPASWPQFRGVNGSGVAPDDKPLPVEFGPEKNVLWKAALPSGHSSPCIWGDRLFLTGYTKADKKLETLCLDRHSGKILWRRTAPAKTIERAHPISNPAVPTPATDGKRVCVYFGSFGLLCYDMDGKELWNMPLPVAKTPYGTGPSPVLFDGMLIVTPMSAAVEDAKAMLESKHPILVIDAQTGKIVWRKDLPKFGVGYATPLGRRTKNEAEVLIFGPGGVMAYDLKDGLERWWAPTVFAQALPTPVMGDGMLFMVSQVPGGDPDDRFKMPPFDELLKKFDKDKDGLLSVDEIGDLVVYSRGGKYGEIRLKELWSFLDKNGDNKLNRFEWGAAVMLARTLDNALLAVRPADKGKATVIWREKRGLGECPSPLYYRGNVYLVKNGGIVTCLDGKTGKLRYRKRLDAGGHFYSSPVAGDGKIYAASQDGIAVVFKAGDSFEPLARNDLGEPVMATPALLEGRIYLRTETYLYAFAEK